MGGLISAEYGLLAEKGKVAAEEFARTGNLDSFTNFSRDVEELEILIREINDCFYTLRDDSDNMEILKRLRDLALPKS